MACNPEVLKRVPLFGLLDSEEAAVLAGQVELKSFAARQRIYKIGDPGGRGYIVVSGRVKVTTIDADGQEVRGQETARFLVYQDEAEMTRRAADHEFLKRLAAAGGGQFHPGEEEVLARYLRELPSQPMAGLRPKANLWPDWRRSSLSAFPPAFLLVFVALVSLEWFLRRRWGMA